MSKFELIQSFYKAWAAGDLEGSLAYCAEDIVWDNVPLKPFKGKARVREFLEKFARGMSNTHYDIKNHLESGDLLMLEGVENYNKGGQPVLVPYMALFKFRDGRITHMSDYFDLATVERQLGLKD